MPSSSRDFCFQTPAVVEELLHTAQEVVVYALFGLLNFVFVTDEFRIDIYHMQELFIVQKSADTFRKRLLGKVGIDLCLIASLLIYDR